MKEVLDRKPESHGYTNPLWMGYAQRVEYGENDHEVLVIVVQDFEANTVLGWNGDGDLVRLSDIRQVFSPRMR